MVYRYRGYEVRKVADIYELVKIGSFRSYGYVGSVKEGLDYIDRILDGGTLEKSAWKVVDRKMSEWG